MTVIGLTMIARSSSDEQTSISQTQEAQAKAVAETGVTAVMQLLNSVTVLADNDISNNVTYDGNANGTDDNEFDGDDTGDAALGWQDEYDNLLARIEGSDLIDTSDDSCSFINGYSNLVTDYVNSANNNSWITVNNNQDRFRILNYNYIADDPALRNSPGTGTLTIEGQANFNENPSTSVIEVDIPVNPLIGQIPGLLVRQANLSNNEVDGDVLINNCNTDGVDETNVTGTVRSNAFLNYPELPTWPNYPDETNMLLNGDGILGNALFGDKTDFDEDGSTVTLPADYPGFVDGAGRNHYIIDAVTFNGNNTLVIQDGEQVTLYLRDNVDISGQTSIVHNCTNQPDCLTNFQIFGNNNADRYNGGTGSAVTQFCLSGNSTVDAFIYLPDAEVGVNGTGSGNGITGTVWADQWSAGGGGSCSSNAGQTVVVQAADWNNLPITAPRQITAPSRWERRSTNAN